MYLDTITCPPIEPGKEHGNNSNVFRIFASVKQGKFTHDGIKYEQVSLQTTLLQIVDQYVL